MSCCPGIRCKNTGSGYVKPDGDGAKELDVRMNEMLEARRTMDERIWNRDDAKTQPERQTPVVKQVRRGAKDIQQ
jgi:hypothetical protein